MHKYWALAFTVGYTVFLTVLSLISLNHLPTLGSSFDDKIYHLGAYMVLMLLWYNFLKRTTLKPVIVVSALIAFSYGIIVEVLQGVFTDYRLKDIADVFANSIGIACAILLILVFRNLKLK